MLFNPDWNKTKADPLSLESLIAWLEKQPARKTYCFLDNGACLLSQYFAHAYGHPVWVGGVTYNPDGPEEVSMAGTPIPGVLNHLAYQHPRTFGAALGRARKIVAAGVR